MSLKGRKRPETKKRLASESEVKSTGNSTNHGTDICIQNYCLSFIDLLGQREAMKGHSLVPLFNSEDEKKKFLADIKDSVGAIAVLQNRAQQLIDPFLSDPKESPLRATLPTEVQSEWDEAQATKISIQRWSDGLAVFSALGDSSIKCHMNAIFGLIAASGSFVFLGLASKKPLRGAIEIAWGVELSPGELYGPVVARAYELESTIAALPRIVVGPNVIDYIQSHARNPAQDNFSKINKSLAEKCLEMICDDADGQKIVHYLGKRYHEDITRDAHNELFSSL